MDPIVTGEVGKRLDEHAEVLDKIQGILQNYEPTREMGLFEGLSTLTKELMEIPAETFKEKLGHILESVQDIAEKMPRCVCPACLAEAGLADMTRERIFHAQFSKLLNQMFQEIDPAKFKGFVLAIATSEKDGSVTTWSRNGATDQEALRTMVGIVGVDFFLEMPDGISDEAKMNILVGAVEEAKFGGKWQRAQAKKEIFERLTSSGRNPMKGRLMEITGIDALDKLKEALLGAMPKEQVLDESEETND